MISLELAKKLKDAGLKRKLEIGDKVYMEGRIITVFVFDNDYPDNSPDCLIPSLEQIITEIEKKKVWITLENYDDGNWKITIFYSGKKSFTADSPEEAAALALLWILEQEANA